MQPSVALFHYPAGWSQGPHADEIDGVSLVLAGRLVERCGRREVQAGPGHLVLKPAEAVHRTRFVSDTVVLRFECAGILGGGNQPILWQWLACVRVARRFLASLERGSEGELRSEAIRDLAVLGVGAPDSSSAGIPAWLGRVHEELADRAHEGVTVDMLAQHAGVHPVSLARAYRRHFGHSPSEALQRHRLGRALGAAILEAEPLSRAAATGGLSDQSHLTRTCRAFLGITPREALARSGAGFTPVRSIQAPRVRRVYPPTGP